MNVKVRNEENSTKQIQPSILVLVGAKLVGYESFVIQVINSMSP